MGFSIWSYTTSKQLAESDIDTSLSKAGKRMGYIYFLILIVAIIIAFLIPIVSIIIYGVFVLLFIIITAFGRAEYAVSLHIPEKPVKGIKM